MSEENNNIIIEANKLTPKNPGRVAYGRKLATMSKELKEKKAGNTEELKFLKKDIKIDKSTKNKLNLHHIEVMVGVGGLLITAIALYFQFKNNNEQIIPQIPQQPINNNPYYSYNDF